MRGTQSVARRGDGVDYAQQQWGTVMPDGVQVDSVRVRTSGNLHDDESLQQGLPAREIELGVRVRRVRVLLDAAPERDGPVHGAGREAAARLGRRESQARHGALVALELARAGIK